MRFAICFVFASFMAAQTPSGSSAPAEPYRMGDLRTLERQLIELLADPDVLKDTWRTANAYSNLGVIYQDLGELKKSEHYYLRGRALLESQQDNPEARLLWARTQTNLASLYIELGQTGKAERLLDVLGKARLPEGDDTARMRGTVAALYMVRGRTREAEELYLSLHRYWEDRANYRDAAVVMNNLGVLAFHRNDVRTATSRFRQAVDSWHRAGADDHPSSLTASANYGGALLASGERAQAVEVLRASLVRSREWFGDKAGITAQISAIYADALEASGDKKQAKQRREEARSITSALAASDPRAHTIDILDLAPRQNSPRDSR